MNIKVTSDSTCDLSQELLDRYNITTIPLYIIKGGKDHRDGIDITPGDIFAHVAAGGDLCTTSALNVSDYTDFFSGFAKDYDAVIHINLSSEFSSCHQNALAAAAEFDNVYPIDSRNLSTGQGLIVLAAAEKSGQFQSVRELCDYLTDLTSKVEASFVLDKLDYMRKGGRCSAVTALGANLLHLKPCIQVAEGKMGVAKKYRGSLAKCLEAYVKDRLSGREDIETDRIFITHSDCDKLMPGIRELVEKFGSFNEILETSAGCSITCHCGPGTLGVLFIRK